MRAIEENDDAKIEEAILRLSRSRRVFAPLAFTIGAFVMLYDGLRLLVSNWRLTLVADPARDVDLAGYVRPQGPHPARPIVPRAARADPDPDRPADRRAHRGELLPQRRVRVRDLEPGRAEIRPAIAQARRHWKAILVSGGITGVLLALSTTVVTRWGRPWFTLSLGIVVGVMMVSYVAVPARLIGAAKRKQSTRDKLSTSVVGGALERDRMHAALHARKTRDPDARIQSWFIPGIVVLALGVTLQAGATGAVRAIKMSATLTTGHHPRSAT